MTGLIKYINKRRLCLTRVMCFHRSVLCNDPDLTVIPNNFPSDTSKLRFEKTNISRIASESFHYLSSLEYLWMSFNSLSSLSVDSFRGLYTLDELRLDGNVLTSFPWECLMDMPNLRLLDLHNNKISSIPAEATIYIRKLDLPGSIQQQSDHRSSRGSCFMVLSPKPPQDAEDSRMILGEFVSVFKPFQFS